MVKRAKKSTRRNKRSRRVNRRSRRQRGGWQTISPADVNDSSMKGPSQLSGAQGTEYKEIHKGQYGGGAPLEGAPVGTTGLLDESLRATARISPLDQSVEAIQGMSDQSGGRRRRRRRGSKKRSSRKRNSRRRHSGGGALNPSDYSASTHLLSPAAESKALMQMSPEWKLAENTTSFAPRS
jgi:hypothetical protein